MTSCTAAVTDAVGRQEASPGRAGAAETPGAGARRARPERGRGSQPPAAGGPARCWPLTKEGTPPAGAVPEGAGGDPRSQLPVLQHGAVQPLGKVVFTLR